MKLLLLPFLLPGLLKIKRPAQQKIARPEKSYPSTIGVVVEVMQEERGEREVMEITDSIRYKISPLSPLSLPVSLIVFLSYSLRK
ncbi:MAG: hypothetical protein L0220_08200 [Acidobacteria bacterium]|nr:hypothetical protein [Acidobacteriota bacterium]